MRQEIQRARTFRRDLSAPEAMLWSRLKGLRERGYHIRRQAPFKGYFLDFVCYTRRVVIEVDGFQHGEDAQGDHDLVRDKILRRHGFVVVRIWAGEVRTNLDGVMETLLAVLAAQPSTRALEARPEAQNPGPGFPTLAASPPVPPH